MNSETIHLNMNPGEADKIAHVLMAALHQPNFMLDSERVTTTRAANDLFDQLKYGYKTNSKGERVELSPVVRPEAKRVEPVCEHPGVFAGDGPEPVHCHHCGKDVPVTEL